MERDIATWSETMQNPIIRAMLQLVPGGFGGLVDVILADGVRIINEERATIFFEALAKGTVPFTEEVIRSNEFLIRFQATGRAAMMASRNEKIRMFAAMLRNGTLGVVENEIDDYEESLSIISDLSYREWQALLIFEDLLANEPRQSDESERQQAMRVKPQLVGRLSVLGVHEYDVSTFMMRMTRSGLWKRLLAVFDDEDSTGTITPRFYRLKEFVKSESGSCDGTI